MTVADKLREASADEPVLAVISKDPSDPSVVSIMQETGGCEDDHKEHRAVALLQLFHQLGIVIYFDDVPGMQHKTILDPQWMLDCITFVIRDYQSIGFDATRCACEESCAVARSAFYPAARTCTDRVREMPEFWKSLRGEASARLLRVLCEVGENHQFRFFSPKSSGFSPRSQRGPSSSPPRSRPCRRVK